MNFPAAGQCEQNNDKLCWNSSGSGAAANISAKEQRGARPRCLVGENVCSFGIKETLAMLINVNKHFITYLLLMLITRRVTIKIG